MCNQIRSTIQPHGQFCEDFAQVKDGGQDDDTILAVT